MEWIGDDENRHNDRMCEQVDRIVVHFLQATRSNEWKMCFKSSWIYTNRCSFAEDTRYFSHHFSFIICDSYTHRLNKKKTKVGKTRSCHSMSKMWTRNVIAMMELCVFEMYRLHAICLFVRNSDWRRNNWLPFVLTSILNSNCWLDRLLLAIGHIFHVSTFAELQAYPLNLGQSWLLYFNYLSSICVAHWAICIHPRTTTHLENNDEWCCVTLTFKHDIKFGLDDLSEVLVKWPSSTVFN